MNIVLYEYLSALIERNYISVTNDENGSEYTIPASAFSTTILFILDNGYIDEDHDFKLTCQYFLEGNIPSGLYTLQYGDTILESASAPVLSRPTTQTARDLISLARKCSTKIITQQKMAQKRNMIMGMFGNHEHAN